MYTYTPFIRSHGAFGFGWRNLGFEKGIWRDNFK